MERFKGEITIFLSLLMSFVLLGVGALTELARASLIKGQIVMDTNNALCSALAEYNRPMLNKYNIFVMDGAYGRANINLKKLTDRMENYYMGATGNSGSLLRYSLSKLELSSYEFATDKCGQAIYKQIIDYMKKKYGLDIVEGLTGLSDGISEYVSNKNQQEETKSSLSEETTKGISFFEGIADLLKGNKMEQVLGVFPASNLCLSEESKLSGRRADLFTGRGMSEPSITDKLLYNKYLLENFKHCRLTNEEVNEDNNTSPLLYEVEYIIGGKNKDRDNLAEVIDKLVLFRQVLNLAYVERDSARVAEAEAIATTLLAITGNPGIIEAGKHVILAAWAHAEAICDVRSLLTGEKVPLNKSAANWHTQMSAIIFPRGTGTHSSESGYVYKDYLNILMLMENTADISIRTMDLMEANIRRTEGYENFSMDNCIVGLGVEGSFDMRHIFGNIHTSKYKYEGNVSYESLKE